MHEARDRTNLIHMPAATGSKDYSTTSTLTEAQSMIFIYCLSMSSLDVLLHLHSHYNCSLDINRMGLCCSQVIWVDRKGNSKQQRRNPKWKGRNNNHLLQWLQSVMNWLATVHHYCFLVSGIRSRAMCQGLHTVSCQQGDWFNTSDSGTSFVKGEIPLLAARQPQHKTVVPVTKQPAWLLTPWQDPHWNAAWLNLIDLAPWKILKQSCTSCTCKNIQK